MLRPASAARVAIASAHCRTAVRTDVPRSVLIFPSTHRPGTQSRPVLTRATASRAYFITTHRTSARRIVIVVALSRPGTAESRDDTHGVPHDLQPLKEEPWVSRFGDARRHDDRA